MSWDQPLGYGVDKVRDALAAMGDGTGTFDDVKAAVLAAQFAVRPTARSVDELAENWDYQVMPDTATDTIQVALFDRTLNIEQYRELMDAASYVGPGEGR